MIIGCGHPGIRLIVDSELGLLKQTTAMISPDVIQLSTLDRPGTESWVESLAHGKMAEAAEFFKPLPVEIIAGPKHRKQIVSFKQSIADQILETIKRRPCTDAELCSILNLHPNELNKYLSGLIGENRIESTQLKRGLFFKIKE